MNERLMAPIVLAIAEHAAVAATNIMTERTSPEIAEPATLRPMIRAPTTTSSMLPRPIAALAPTCPRCAEK